MSKRKSMTKAVMLSKFERAAHDCKFADIAHVLADCADVAMDEIEKLQRIIEGMAERIAKQSNQLGKRAERKPS